MYNVFSEVFLSQRTSFPHTCIHRGIPAYQLPGDDDLMNDVTVVFASPHLALQWVLSLHEAAMRLTWPEKVEAFREVRYHSKVMMRGIRMQVSVCGRRESPCCPLL